MRSAGSLPEICLGRCGDCRVVRRLKKTTLNSHTRTGTAKFAGDLRIVVQAAIFCHLPKMPDSPLNRFTHSHSVSDDGEVAFECSSDAEQWPWLALPPFDPIVVQSINFFATMETGLTRGTHDPTKWTALTQTEWTCGKRGTGHAARGSVLMDQGKEGLYYRLKLFDAADALVATTSGTGVAFRTRDFGAWRKTAEPKAAPLQSPDDFQYAPAEALGLATQVESFVSPLIEGGVPSVRVLIAKENAFVPHHPYHDGSGDHVNSTHLGDACRQFARLVLGDARLVCAGGEMRFIRYIELGRPFHITLVEDVRSENTISMVVRQMERECATAMIRYAPGHAA